MFGKILVLAVCQFFVENTLLVVTKWCFRIFLAIFFHSAYVFWSNFVILTCNFVLNYLWNKLVQKSIETFPGIEFFELNSSLCSFCQGEKETFHHLFSTCNVTTNVWQELTTFFSSKVCLPPLSLQSAVLGFLEDCQHHLFLNNILLMFKITVYRNRSKNIVTARNVLFNLKQRENIEKSIAFTNKKMDFHFTKWHFFHSLVDDTGTF